MKESQMERMREMLLKVQSEGEAFAFRKVDEAAAKWRDCDGDRFDQVLALGRIKGAADSFNPFTALIVHETIGQFVDELRGTVPLPSVTEEQLQGAIECLCDIVEEDFATMSDEEAMKHVAEYYDAVEEFSDVGFHMPDAAILQALPIVRNMTLCQKYETLGLTPLESLGFTTPGESK